MVVTPNTRPGKSQRAKTHRAVAKHISECLKMLGYDLRDPNLRNTPARVASIWMEELYTLKPPTRKLFSVFKEDYNQMVVMVGHKTWARCPHHLERVLLEVSVGYIPKGRVLGLSKLARVADYFAHGLVLQERYVENLAEGLMSALEPQGVGVHVTGRHFCMQARGVETTANVVATALRGLFVERPETQREFLQYVMHNQQRGA
ncbi:MAG: GTP cyclohydrolase I [bacterium]